MNELKYSIQAIPGTDRFTCTVMGTAVTLNLNYSELSREEIKTLESEGKQIIEDQRNEELQIQKEILEKQLDEALGDNLQFHGCHSY